MADKLLTHRFQSGIQTELLLTKKTNNTSVIQIEIVFSTKKRPVPVRWQRNLVL